MRSHQKIRIHASHNYLHSILSISLSILITILFSCTSSQETSDIIPIHEKHPTERFKNSISKLSSIDFVTHSIDVKKYYNYHKHLTVEENKEYYSINPKQHWFLSRNDMFSNCISSGALSKSNSTWGYFVVKKEATVMIPDAMIEEWQFDSHDDAVNAMIEMSEITNSPYIKEPFFLYSSDSCVYLLYTRAHAFKKELQNIFKILKNEIGEKKNVL